MRLPKAEGKPQRATMAMRINNDYTTSGDPSRHILSREVENEVAAGVKDFTNSNDTLKLQSSFAKRQTAFIANPTFNPFRSKSTPPLLQQSAEESACMNRF